ncbi:MAG: flagellar motor protein MotB [Gammaproteobacteria bacterium]|nr:flagellar motor protein MotB [Gammaproteobacteria bacterium]
MQDKTQPIIIKKIVGGHGHHGGAWKVAFADFATAMMAFFLLLWLMGSTTKEQKGAISEYFNNPSQTPGASQSPNTSPIQGPGGSSTSLIELGGAMDITDGSGDDPEKEFNKENIDAQTAEQIAEALEEKRLESLMESLKHAIEQSQALKPYKDQLFLDISPEGLRIQIVDKENRPMFDSGSANLKNYTDEILRELAGFINTVPNKISITGHTDSTLFGSRRDYTNWELSADRANAARRSLLAGGMDPTKSGRVVGLSDTVPFDKTNPENPINRRISIIVMNKKTEDAINQQNTADARTLIDSLPEQKIEQSAVKPAGDNSNSGTIPSPVRQEKPAGKTKDVWKELDGFLEK